MEIVQNNHQDSLLEQNYKQEETLNIEQNDQSNQVTQQLQNQLNSDHLQNNGKQNLINQQNDQQNENEVLKDKIDEVQENLNGQENLEKIELNQQNAVINQENQDKQNNENHSDQENQQIENDQNENEQNQEQEQEKAQENLNELDNQQSNDEKDQFDKQKLEEQEKKQKQEENEQKVQELFKKCLQTKDEGNKLFQNQKYLDAIQIYTTALQIIHPNNFPKNLINTKSVQDELQQLQVLLMGNLSQGYLQIGNYETCMKFCDQVAKHSEGEARAKAYFRKAKCYQQQNDFILAFNSISKAKQSLNEKGLFNKSIETLYNEIKEKYQIQKDQQKQEDKAKFSNMFLTKEQKLEIKKEKEEQQQLVLAKNSMIRSFKGFFGVLLGFFIPFLANKKGFINFDRPLTLLSSIFGGTAFYFDNKYVKYISSGAFSISLLANFALNKTK